MPELPDIIVYIEALGTRVLGRTLRRIHLANPFLLRTVDPPIEAIEGMPVAGLHRMGKRIVFAFDGDLFLVVHLMIAGRLRWREVGKKPPAITLLARMEFDEGHLFLTEAGTKRRASLHLLRGSPALRALDPGGIEVLDSDLGEFRAALLRESHTLKRALTDPRLFSGIGNAFSDEILHRARLSPFRLTTRMDEEEIQGLHAACLATLSEWIDRTRRETGAGFPEKVTAFREGMAVHGRYRRPCPVCGAPVQRIVYAENEANYCARCQTEGRLLADRALSRLLKGDWPRTLEELEEG